MSHSSVLKQEKFWQVLTYLTGIHEKTDWRKACGDLQITTKQLNSFLVFLKEVEYVFEIEKGRDGKELFLNPPLEKPSIDFHFTLLEWLQFQAHFPKIHESQGEPYHEPIAMKLEEFENEFSRFDLFSPLDVFEHSQGVLYDANNKQALNENLVLAELEKAVISERCVRLELYTGKTHIMKVYPRKIVYLDEHLCLICENTSDHTLMQIDLTSIKTAMIDEKEWNAVFSKIEVDEFVSSMRKMSDLATRLVLKIKSYEKFQLNLGHQFFENPCVFSNGDGDIIWAATIEPNEKIFQWLQSLGQEVEILESSQFKRRYLDYCESKLKKLA